MKKLTNFTQMNKEWKVCAVYILPSLVFKKSFVCVMHNMSAAGVLRATSWAPTTAYHQLRCPHIFVRILKTVFSPFQVDVGVGTEMGTMTEPDCLGPLDPGTTVSLEGIVWNESDGKWCILFYGICNYKMRAIR